MPKEILAMRRVLTLTAREKSKFIKILDNYDIPLELFPDELEMLETELNFFFAKKYGYSGTGRRGKVSPRRTTAPRKLSAWNKYVKNKRNHIKYRDGKLNLKKMGVAFRRSRR